MPRFHGARVWELRGALPTQTSALCASRSAALEFYNQTVHISIMLSVSPLGLSSKLSDLKRGSCV